MAALTLDVSLPLRDFELALGLDVDGTVALVGPSGAGKTSLLRIVAGLVRGNGRVIYRDQPWLDTARKIDLHPEDRRVGLVFQEYALFPHLSVRANVGYAGKSRVDELLERFHIAHLADARPEAQSAPARRRCGEEAPANRDRSSGVGILRQPRSRGRYHSMAEPIIAL